MSNKPKNLGGGTVILGGGGIRKVLRDRRINAQRLQQGQSAGGSDKPQGLGGGPPVV